MASGTSEFSTYEKLKNLYKQKTPEENLQEFFLCCLKFL